MQPERDNRRVSRLLVLSMGLLFFFSVFCVDILRAEVKGVYLYDLSDFTGPIRYSAPRISVDQKRNEVSVLYQNSVRVFNENGMEVYRFGDDLDLGTITDLTVDGDGNILLLLYGRPPEYAFKIVRCNFRGEPVGSVELRNLPNQFSRFSPHRMIYQDGKLYLANTMDLMVLVTDSDGAFRESHDVFSMLGLQEKNRGNVEMGGFSVAHDGSMLFTVPVLFTAYRVYPGGRITSFGRPGSAPGRFNIVGGMVLDSQGNYLVVDRLKCTVMIFDPNHNYLTQFGFRGFKPGNLIVPDDIAIDKTDRVFVTQNGKRGVSVYRITHG